MINKNENNNNIYLKMKVGNINNNNQNNDDKIDKSVGNVNLSNDENKKKNALLMFENLLNNKNKFKLDNHFDNKNCEIFLSEKEKYLAEIIIDDDTEHKKNKIYERNKSKEDILIPNGAPTKFTFGQL